MDLSPTKMMTHHWSSPGWEEQWNSSMKSWAILSTRLARSSWDAEASIRFTITGQGWIMPDGTPLPWPVIVLQSQAREPVKKGHTQFYFVTDGIHSAVAKAQERAG